MLIPCQNGIGPFYDSFFGDLGKNPTEVVFNSVRHPTKTWNLARQHDRKTWYFNMFAPWAFVPLLDLRMLRGRGRRHLHQHRFLVSVPRDYRFHYSAIVVGGCAVATVEAIAWISNRAKDRLATQASMVSVVLVCALVASYMLGCAPYSRHYEDGAWPLLLDPTASGRGASHRIDSDTGVGERGVQHRHAHDPPGEDLRVPGAVVQHQLGGTGRAPRRSHVRRVSVAPRRRCSATRDKALLSDLLSSEFVVVSETQTNGQDVLVAKRIRPPGRPARRKPPRRPVLPPASRSIAFNRAWKAGG